MEEEVRGGFEMGMCTHIPGIAFSLRIGRIRLMTRKGVHRTAWVSSDQDV